MESENRSLRAHFVPYLTTSHLMPHVDMALMFAARGVDVTIITTQYNAFLFEKSIDEAVACGHHIKVHKLKFPSKEAGLPEGIENLAQATSAEVLAKIAKGLFILHQTFEQFIRDNKPDLIVADMMHFWANDVASELGIPRLTSHVTSYFGICVEDYLFRHEPQKTVRSDDEQFLLPGLPGRMQLTRAKIPNWVKENHEMTDLMRNINESISKSYGVMVNSIHELEKDYIDYYRDVLGMKSWAIGPGRLFLARNKSENVDKHCCLNWLDSQNTNSVIYISFGTLCFFSSTQLSKIAEALDSMNHPFIWVVRNADKKSKTEMLPREFEEKMAKSKRGLIIKDWAPQKSILEHPAVGGFLTHCGWNSIMETIVAGVPVATWPLGSEQFYNEELTQVLGIGVKVGCESWTPFLNESSKHVEKEKIVKAVNELLGVGGDAEKRRKKVKELSVIAKAAVKEGGSSHSNLNALLNELGQLCLSN